MANILTHTGNEPAILSAEALRSLLARGDGDAALLYLALLRHQGTLAPRALTKELRWEPSRMDAAERVLRELGLVTPDVEEPEDVQEPEKKGYQQGEMAFQLENNPEFLQLTAQVESRLGKRLSPADLSKLLGLLNNVGLPSDVIYTLVNHCMERRAARPGGRRLTMTEIERTGFKWAGMGIDTQAAAADYLKRYARREEDYADYMRVLNMGGRTPVKKEESYLAAWREMEFPPEAVALAYEKTVFRCHEFKWEYCNGILEDWHKAGLHTVAEIEKNDRPGKKKSGRAGKKKKTEVSQYVRQFMEEMEEQERNDEESGAAP